MWERKIVDVTPLNEIDPTWSCVDEQGHVHRWKFGKEMLDVDDDPSEYRPSIDSVEYVVDSESFGDYPERGHYECKICRERIELGFRSPPFRRYKAM